MVGISMLVGIIFVGGSCQFVVGLVSDLMLFLINLVLGGCVVLFMLQVVASLYVAILVVLGRVAVLTVVTVLEGIVGSRASAVLLVVLVVPVVRDVGSTGESHTGKEDEGAHVE